LVSEERTGVATFVDLLRRRADHLAEQPAFIFLTDGETEASELTYGELDRRARAIAARLQSLGARGDRAILLYPPGLDYIAAFFGCLYAGVVAVPAYPPQRKRMLGRLRAVLTDSGASMALATAKIHAGVERLCRQNSEMAELGDVQWIETDVPTEGIETIWRMPSVAGQTLAFLQYTSGSTGSPKGVMVSHENLLHNQRTIQEAFGHNDNTTVLGWLPLYHDMGLIGNVLQPLYLARPCVLMSPMHFMQKPFRWLSAISRYHATTSGAPNFAYDLCVRQISLEERDQLDLSCWSVAFNGAEPIHAGTLDRFADIFRPCGFKREAFYPCYGLAEATLFVSGGEHGAAPVVKLAEKAALEKGEVIAASQADSSATRLVGCGRTAVDQQLVIVNPETFLRCPHGQVGEIWVKGASVAQGYWNREETTAQTFAATIGDTGEGPFLRTGDLGVIQDRELFVVGRLKDLIIIRGRNHYPHDIETTVQESHPSLRPGCGAAFSVEVDEEERLVVVQEVEQRTQSNLHEVAAAVRHAVAEQHDAHVHAVVLIKAGSLPKTSSGKIQRLTCRDKFVAGSLDVLEVIEESMRDLGVGKAAFMMPWSPTEQAIAEIWAQVLGRKPIARDDHFFALGGDSLRAAQVIARLNQTFHIELSIDCLFERITVVQLAEHIAACRPADSPCIPLIPAISSPEKRETAEGHPLSFSQQRLWFLDHVAAGVPLNNIPVALRLDGQLDIPAMEQGLREIVRRHETLRTTFISRDGQPVQVIASPSAVELPVVDLRHVVPVEREAEVSRLVQEEARRSFNLGRGPLLRACLLRLHETAHIFILTVHHIIADDWSMGVLSRELSALYDAFRRGAPSPLPELPVQYIDVACHQRQRLLQGDRLAALLAYWKAQLAGSPPLLNLPTDRPRSSVPTFQGARQTFGLSKPLTDALKTLSQQEGVTLFMTLLAAFQTLLLRYTGQVDISIGCPIANREQVEAEALIGFFVNLLIFRVRLDGNPSFRDLLGRVRETAIGAYAHQALPFEMLVEELHPERRLRQTPLFQVLFVLQNTSPTLELQGISVTRLEAHSQTSQFDLTLSMLEEAGGLAGTIEYSTDLFEDETIACMVGHLKTLLVGIVERPELCLSELPLLTEQERRQVLYDWNATQKAYPQDHAVHQLVEAQAAQIPDAVAVVCGLEELTYRELNTQANQLARVLRRRGVGPEVLVGICMERSLEMVVGLLGILKAGGAYVPIDPHYPPDRMAYMLDDVRAPMLLTQQRLLGSLPRCGTAVICLDRDWPEIAAEDGLDPVPLGHPHNLAYVIYTSGSTGRPKGVALTHRSAAAFVHWAGMVYGGEELQGVLASTSICFDLSVFELFVTLSLGGRVILVENALALPSLLNAHEVTLINTVPSAIRELLHQEAIPQAVRTVNLAGEPLPSALVDQLYAVGSIERVFDLYGPSEDTTYSTSALRRVQGPVTIGRPIANTQTYVLGPWMEPVPIGVPGELYLGGLGLARGYHRRPGLSAEKFVPDPFGSEPGGRLYRTGDLVRYRQDGVIEFLGRLDHQVKLRGFRIELGEIEAVLSRHPAVRETIVLAREDQPGEKRLVAYIVGQSGQTWTCEEIRRFLKAELPDYMVPTAIVPLDFLPLTPNGKVDRRMLPVPGAFPPRSLDVSVLPQSEIERAIAAVWREVLRLDTVSLHDNFFDLGGHSLQLARVWSKLCGQLQRRFSLLDLFRYPTIHALATFLAKDSPEAMGSTCNSVPKERIRAGQHRLKQQQIQRRQAKTSHQGAR
jgi:amino acid adenylation domain-containing protein